MLGLASIENSHMHCVSKGLRWGDHREAALCVAMEYLTALEGEFWVALRGSGLTYGSSLHLDREEGLIYFTLSRCANPAVAHEAAKAIFADYATGAKKLQRTEFENTKSSLMNATLCYWETKSGALRDTFRRWFFMREGADSDGYAPMVPAADYRRGFMARVAAVSQDDVKMALCDFIVPLFDPSRSYFFLLNCLLF